MVMLEKEQVCQVSCYFQTMEHNTETCQMLEMILVTTIML